MSDMTDYDPYQHLLELTEFCKTADQHISQLIKNQEVMRTSINQLHNRMAEIELQLSLMEITDGKHKN